MTMYAQNARVSSKQRVNDAQNGASVPALPVTVVARASRPGDVQHTTLGAVLERFRRPSEHLQALISRIRTARSEEERKALKRELAQVVFSGTFARRQNDGIQSYSGILTVDLDADHNPGRDLPGLKPLLAQDPYVLAAFISPSGNGLKLLVRVAEPIAEVTDPGPLQKAHARAARAFFGYLRATYGLIADDTPDLSRACFATVDPALHFNPDAEIFRFRHEVELPPVASSGDCAADLELIESALAALPLDGSLKYHLWLKVLFALASAVGEDAAVELMLKHTRDARDTEEYIRQRLKSYRGEVQLGTLFWLAGQYGWRPPRKERATSKQTARPEQEIEDDSDELLFWRPFPLDLLPASVADYVRAGSAAVPCDPAMLAVPVLAVLSAAAGSAARVRLKRSWAEPATLWCVVATPSGTAKSAALELALRPVYELEAEAAARYRAEREAYEQRLKEWKTLDKELRASIPEPQPPRPVRYRLSDATLEAVAAVHRDNPRGVLLARDELSGWIASFDRYAQTRGGDLASWLELYEGRPVVVDRKTDPEPIRIERPHVPVIGTVQPWILRERVSPELLASGFVARLTIAMPPEVPRRFTDADVDEATEAAYARLVRRMYQTGDVELSLSIEARRLFGAFVEELDEERRQLPDGPLRSASAKIEAKAARLALLFQLAEDVEAGRQPREVTGAAMQRAIELARWFWYETQRVYARMRWSGLSYAALHKSPAERLLDEMPDSFTAGDWEQAVVAKGKHRATAYRWLQKLQEAGLVEAEDRGTYRKSRICDLRQMRQMRLTTADSAFVAKVAQVALSHCDNTTGPGDGLGGSGSDGPPVASVAPAGDLQDGWIRLLPDDEGGADDQPGEWFDPFEDEPEPAAEARPTTPPDVPNDPAELRAFVLQRAEAAGWPSLWLDGFGATHGLPKMWQAAVERLGPEQLKEVLETIEKVSNDGAPF